MKNYKFILGGKFRGTLIEDDLASCNLGCDIKEGKEYVDASSIAIHGDGVMRYPYPNGVQGLGFMLRPFYFPQILPRSPILPSAAFAFANAKCGREEGFQELAMATLHMSLRHGHHLLRRESIARRPFVGIARLELCGAVPLSGLVRCVFSEKNGRSYSVRQSNSRGPGRALRRSLVLVQASSSSSSQSTSQSSGENSWEGFNPDDYEQHEETEDEARERNWKERGYEVPLVSIEQFVRLNFLVFVALLPPRKIL